jgi:hypothetical protein
MVLRLIRGNGQRALGPKDARAYVGKKRYLQSEGRFCRVLEVLTKCLTLNQLGPMQDWHCECVL